MMRSRDLAAGMLLCWGAVWAQQETMLDEFTISSGLKATVWAGTDLIHSPVAMDVDAKSRVWVTEDLQHAGEAGAPHARIKILADTDNDGRADSAKIFGPSFDSKPMGISVFDNVVVVSMAPAIHVYTDVDRDDVFDPKVDKEAIIAKGFHGANRDHGLHAVVPGPSGKWYVNTGNLGADLTMPDGRVFHASSYYSENRDQIGKDSWDGRRYVGGFGLRMDPDGRNAEVIFHNTRNTHAMQVTSYGDVLQADNDDPTNCRGAWAMEYANFGFASLEDGSRSWKESAKSWERREVTAELKKHAYEGHMKKNLRRDEGHWRENVPGVTPPGNVWGPGGPAGDYFIEGDELGKAYRGRYLVCETVHRSLFSFLPKLQDAQVELVDLDKAFFAADRKSRNRSASDFMPTDAVANVDGALFVSDWNSRVNSRRSGNGEGAIFRISRADETAVELPKIDFSTTAGLLAALKSPAPGVRWVAQDKLKRTAGAVDALLAFIAEHADNPYYRARAVFILAQVPEAKGPAYVKALLKSGDAQERIVAFRALRFAGREAILPLVAQVADDPSPAVRREALHALRNVPLDEAAEPLAKLVEGYDGKNRWYLEAVGSVCDGRSAEVYARIVKPRQPNPKTWNARQRNLAWRLRSKAARQDLVECILAQNPPVDEFRHLAYTFGLCYSEDERKDNFAALRAFADHPAFRDKVYQEIVREFLAKDVNDPPPEPLTQSWLFPKAFGTPTQLGTVEEIAELEPDFANGRVKVAMCQMCHVVDDRGVSFGPNLTDWGAVQEVEAIVRAMVEPSAELAHDYERPVVVTQNGHRLEGIAKGYSGRAGTIRVSTMGGTVLKVPFRKPRAKIEYLEDHSWMPSASAMGLSNQDVRDIAAYLMGDQSSSAEEATPRIVPNLDYSRDMRNKLRK